MRCVGRSWERSEGRENVALIEFRRRRERVLVDITQSVPEADSALYSTLCFYYACFSITRSL